VIDLDYGVKLITRDEWGARRPRLQTHLDPSFGATRHWEGPHMGTFGHESCAPKVRGIQAFHMDDPDRLWSDIAYTGVVCPHGYVFEGRSLFVRTAANGTFAGNSTAYAFCYLGGEGDPFTEGGKRAMKAAMNWTRTHGGAGTGRNDHNDWKATACPGAVIEAWGDGGEPITLEDDLPTPAEVWAHPIDSKVDGELRPAKDVLGFAQAQAQSADTKATQLAEAVAALTEALAQVPAGVWDHEIFEQISQVNVLASQMLGGAHYWAYVGVNGEPGPAVDVSDA
jgi:hypothetical protein